MFWVDLFLDITNLIDDIRHAKRYGIRSLLWSIASFICMVTAVVFFCFDLVVPGIIGILGMVACIVCSSRRAICDMRQKNTEEQKTQDP